MVHRRTDWTFYVVMLDLLLFTHSTNAFSPSKTGRINTPLFADTVETSAAAIGSTTVSTDHYDIVTVDLDNDRDYPIYIGTGYSDQEGTVYVIGM